MKLFFKIYLILLLTLYSGCVYSVFAQGEVSQEEAPTAEAGQQGVTTEAVPAGTDAVAQVPQATTTTIPVLEIKRLETEEPFYSLELRDVDITDLFRVLAHDYKLNLMVDKDVEGKVTASLTNVSLEEALETIAESQNLVLKKKGNIIKVVPNLITRTFTLKFMEAKKVLEGSSSASTAAETTAETAESAVSAVTQESTIYDLLSNKGKVFLGKQPNSIIVIDYPPNMEKVEEYLKIIDQRMASRSFKLKYLKATDVVGESSTATGTTSSTTETAAETSATGS